MTRAEDRRDRRAALGRRWAPLAAAIVTPLFALLIGADLPHALLLGGGLVIATLVSRALPYGNRAAWPVLPYGRRAGARRDVSSLTWTMIDRSGSISSTGEQRLRTVLTAALELRGVDLDSTSGREQAAAVVGSGVARWLSDPEAPTPDPRAVRRTIAHLLDENVTT
ncbi:hypothetical protein [Ruania zhangjianzhongii]|uniref:hypothetical protein n=1 Tax=Ruania zhangjianzhongii TaxID=2603206 RepID=UPI0011D1DC01|nr:hypothetical protein [Ruania zhangjianzhongii]